MGFSIEQKGILEIVDDLFYRQGIVDVVLDDLIDSLFSWLLPVQQVEIRSLVGARVRVTVWRLVGLRLVSEDILIRAVLSGVHRYWVADGRVTPVLLRKIAILHRSEVEVRNRRFRPLEGSIGVVRSLNGPVL